MGGEDELEDDFRFFGLREEAAQYAQRVPEVFEVFPENEKIVEVFVTLETQWRIIAGMGGFLYQGLDYGNARDTIEMMGIDRSEWPDILSGLRIMESAATTVLNKQDS